jgi:hypothetical protein
VGTALAATNVMTHPSSDVICSSEKCVGDGEEDIRSKHDPHGQNLSSHLHCKLCAARCYPCYMRPEDISCQFTTCDLRVGTGLLFCSLFTSRRCRCRAGVLPLVSSCSLSSSGVSPETHAPVGSQFMEFLLHPLSSPSHSFKLLLPLIERSELSETARVGAVRHSLIQIAPRSRPSEHSLATMVCISCIVLPLVFFIGAVLAENWRKLLAMFGGQAKAAGADVSGSTEQTIKAGGRCSAWVLFSACLLC